MFGSPIGHRIQDRLQGLTVPGQRVINSRRHLGEDLATNDSILFQFSQLLRQHLPAYVRDVTLQLAESADAQAIYIIKDDRFPFSSDDIHGGSHRAAFLIDYLHSYQKVPTTILDCEPLYYIQTQRQR